MTAITVDRLPAVRYDWLACGTLKSGRRRKTRRIAVFKMAST